VVQKGGTRMCPDSLLKYTVPFWWKQVKRECWKLFLDMHLYKNQTTDLWLSSCFYYLSIFCFTSPVCYWLV